MNDINDINDFRTTWNSQHPNLSYDRAVELEGHEYPRFDTAYFQFERLTPEEQRLTIQQAERDLADQKTEVKKQYQLGKQCKGTDFNGQGMRNHKDALRIQRIFQKRVTRLKKMQLPS